ncbi:MAG: GHKL domain-containing protein [Gammaproteobacteria bacterium]|nr:GHKL domain-containing protein [Gammaproteobacteria bacterium]
MNVLTASVSDPILAGCILGKYNRAHELGVVLKLDNMTHVGAIPTHIPVEQLVSVLGNIIDNAFDATRANPNSDPGIEPVILVSMNDYGDDLVFEVTDGGTGVASEDQERIFEKGISSKHEAGHGYGLYLARSIVEELGGQIMVEAAEGGGAQFIVYIPKQGVS